MTIRQLLEALNARPMRRLGVSRRQLFERLDRPALAPLPAEPFEYAEWRRCRVGLDYHVEVLGHWYSVPHRLARAVVDDRLVHNAHRLELKGESMRRRAARRAVAVDANPES